jgi:hypothetical protein
VADEDHAGAWWPNHDVEAIGGRRGGPRAWGWAHLRVRPVEIFRFGLEKIIYENNIRFVKWPTRRIGARVKSIMVARVGGPVEEAELQQCFLKKIEISKEKTRKNTERESK